MGKKIKFTKMHGAGNDYIYVNTLLYNIPDPEKASIVWSRPHFGIGSDGLVLIGKAASADADFSMHIYNNDGSEAMMCGNASRCIGKYLYDKKVTTKNPIRLETLSGIKILNLSIGSDDTVDAVTVDMGEPILQNEEQFAADGGKATEKAVEIDGETFHGTFVSMGNPHFVIFLPEDTDLDSFALSTYGPKLENHPLFPQRCNIEFATILADGTVRMRVWERGSGITLACGTGACATAVAASLTGRRPRQSNIAMDGGTLSIEWSETTGHIMMTGPAAFAFEGEIESPL